MLSNTTPGKRTAGKLMIFAAVAVALPLTASRAIEYVDVSAPQPPKAPQPPAAPLVPAALAMQPAAPLAPTPPVPPVAPAIPLQMNGDNVTINGQTKNWDDLTPAEKQHIRGELAKARAELARTKIDRADIERQVRTAISTTRIDKEELRRDLTEARAEIDQAMREIDANAASIRRSGQNPEAIKAQIRASLKAVEAIDVEAITRQALASVDPAAIAASAAAAEAGLAQAQAEIERLERRLDDRD